MTSSLLDELNPEQRSAVEHDEGPLLVLAGAGTGKTRTMTRRVAHLVQERGVAPGRILAVTFTNKAAREMRSRIQEWVPHTGLWVGTFHGTCARMLRLDPEPVGRTRDYTILDTDDRRRLLKRLIKEQKWDASVIRPRAIESILSRWKRMRLDPESAAAQTAMGGLMEERAATIYARYEPELAKQNSLDFDDLLLGGLRLLEHDGPGAQAWRQRFDHVLVDEYQDTNEVQYQFVRLLTEASKNLAVCGDPDQSIYRWRGADIGNILRFEEDFSGATVVRLERNYRSLGNILRAAQAVIRNNRSRKEKDLITDQEDGPPLLFTESPDEEMEALSIAGQLKTWIDEGTSAQEVAVFYRTNACSRPLEAALTRLRIPYQIVGGLSFFERREIKDVLAYARMVVNPCDDVAVERILNVPPRGIGKTTLARLHARAQDLGESLLHALKRPEVRETMGSRARKALTGFLSVWARIAESTQSAEVALRNIVQRTGYHRYAESMGDTEDVDRVENLDELLAFAGEYDERESGGLRGFLEEVVLLTDQDRWEEGAQRISLMTVHAAKGLEFDRVAVVGLEEGFFPHIRAFDDPDGLEEERRLFYVALTRARKELHLSCSRLRFRTGQPGPQTTSRFLDEVPKELLGDGGLESASTVCEDLSNGSCEYKKDDLVQHATFGLGQVLDILGRGVNLRVVVRFQNESSARHLLVAYAPLEKVDS